MAKKRRVSKATRAKISKARRIYENDLAAIVRSRRARTRAGAVRVRRSALRKTGKARSSVSREALLRKVVSIRRGPARPPKAKRPRRHERSATPPVRREPLGPPAPPPEPEPPAPPAGPVVLWDAPTGEAVSPFRLSEFESEMAEKWATLAPGIPVLIHFVLKIDQLLNVGGIGSDAQTINDLIEIEAQGGDDFSGILSDFYDLVRESGYYGADPDAEGVDEEQMYSAAPSGKRRTAQLGKARYAVFVTQVIAFQ